MKMEGEKEEEILASEKETHLHLSVLDSHRFDGLQTIKLTGSVLDHPVVLMVDSGATHCFVAESFVQTIGWSIDRGCRLLVRLGDGSQVRTGGICHDMPIQLNGELYEITCYMFPLRNVDFILGVAWLATLGEVKANWANLTLKFEREGRLQVLQGNPALSRRECDPHQLQKMETDDKGWWLWALNGGAGEVRCRSAMSGGDEGLEREQREQIATLLKEFSMVATDSLTLPPARVHDHRITLQPGVSPI